VTEQGRPPAGGYGFREVVAAAWVPVGGGPPTRPFGYQIFAKAAGETGSVVVGLLAVAAFVALVVGLVVWSRRRSGRQIEAGKRSGQLLVEMGLDFACLPGDWPTIAQETLNPMLTSGRGRLRWLPVRVTAKGGHLEIDKRRSFLLGAPFQAEVSTAEITGVTVGPPLAGITGSGITIALRGGEEPRGHVPVGGESAEDLAAQLRALMGGWSGRAAACGIRVTSPPPPKRTPPWRPWLLMMATFPSVAIANVPQDGVAGYGGAWMAVLYTVWLNVRRQLGTDLAAGLPAVGRRLRRARPSGPSHLVIEFRPGQPVPVDGSRCPQFCR